MVKISVIGTSCLDKIKWADASPCFESLGGIIYLITALSGLFPDDMIYPVTKVCPRYGKKFAGLLNNYSNVSCRYIYQEKTGRMNIVNLTYGSDGKTRCEKSFLNSTRIDFSQIRPVLNFSDLIVVTYISGYDISLQTLEKTRSCFQGTLFGDIHSFILTRSRTGFRRYRTIKHPERWLENFDIVQGSEIEWEVLLRSKFPALQITNRSWQDKIHNFKKISSFLFSLGIKIVILSMGKDGVLGGEKKGQKINFYHVPGILVNDVKDTTGCGDTLSAGIIWGLLKKNDLLLGLETGNFLAAVKSKRCGFFTKDEILSLLKDRQDTLLRNIR
ncbi:MAG: carbohydrate kinase family protein [Spirochaetes bacterium]|nr:carbohydrate kinase family protein [Spirochaetota bacterium]